MLQITESTISDVRNIAVIAVRNVTVIVNSEAVSESREC